MRKRWTLRTRRKSDGKRGSKQRFDNWTDAICAWGNGKHGNPYWTYWLRGPGTGWKGWKS